MERVADPGVHVRFWGVRGSIPAPGPETCHYGGNTACVEIRAAGELLILDAGTGIRKLGLSLEQEEQPVVGTLLISHAHWDHIHGFPFFAPAMTVGNCFRVFGGAGTAAHVKEILARQMETPFFPISLDDLPDTLQFHELGADPVTIGPVRIQSATLHHPGQTLGFRIEAAGRTLVYATDHEPLASLNGAGPRPDPTLVRLATEADLLICDAQYTSQEYQRHIGWGHTSIPDAVRLALKAKVKRLALFHHDPERTDAELDALLATTRAEIARRRDHLECLAAAEGLRLQL